MSDAREAQTTRLILVHGTWGRGFFAKAGDPEVIVSEERGTSGSPSNRRQRSLRWFEPGSAFRGALAKGLIGSEIKFTTRVLLWDGRNSIVSRNKAAIVLAELIKSLAREASGDPIVVVAHSHGGNVALRAAHIASAEAVANLKVVTLATPFLQIYTHTTFREDEIDYSPPLGKDALAFLHVSVSAILGLPFAAAILIPFAIYQDTMRALLQPISFIDP